MKKMIHNVRMLIFNLLIIQKQNQFIKELSLLLKKAKLLKFVEHDIITDMKNHMLIPNIIKLMNSKYLDARIYVSEFFNS